MRESSPDSDTLSPSILSDIQKWAAIILPLLVTLLSRLASARIGAQNGESLRGANKSGIAGPDESPANVAPGTRKDHAGEEIALV